MYANFPEIHSLYRAQSNLRCISEIVQPKIYTFVFTEPLLEITFFLDSVNTKDPSFPS